MIRSGVFPWLGRTLTRKFVLLLLGFLVLQSVQIAAGVLGVLHIGAESAQINSVGRQRAATLLLPALARRALAAGAWARAERVSFDAALADYDRLFAHPPRVHNGAAREAELTWLLREADAAWRQELRPLLRSLDPRRAPEMRSALARYEALALPQLARLDRLVALLEADVRADSRTIAVIQVMILAATLLLGAAGLLVARYAVSLPLRRLIDATQAIAGGAYDRRLPVASHDELGELAGTFNRMAAAVEANTGRITALNRVAAAIAASLSLREIVDEVLARGVELIGGKAAGIVFYDEDRGEFGERYTRGLSERFLSRMAFRPGGLADQVFSRGAPILCSDHPQAEHKLSALARDEGVRAYLCLPLISHTSRLGVLFLYRADTDLFTPEEVGLLSAFARLAAQAIENARLHARTEGMAVTDSLTGLNNRRWLDSRLQEEVQRSQRFGKPLGVLMLDIDHFKRVNDRYGHPAGDTVLKRLAEVLAGQLREVDRAARYGGEEFVAILPETDDDAAQQGAERIRRAVAEAAFRLPDGSDIAVTVSIGVVSFPGSAADAEELIARADQALYVAKHSGRNVVVLYRDMLTAEIDKDPNRIVELLREDLRNIQPIVTAVAAKATFYRGHNDAVEQAALRLAEALKLAPVDREALRLASQLHDIGMAVMPATLLNKRTTLTPAEWRKIRKHPAIAAQFLEQVPALRSLAPIVRHHHERWDGSGYPDGLRARDIPYLARVLAVADAYGALVSDWLGHAAASPAAAVAALRAAAGTQLDPEIADALLQAMAADTPVAAPH
jgi:diguanylate cyclase (GGDEF)-like protein